MTRIIQNKELKPLVKVKAIIEDMNLEVTYEYDDLVFVKHNAFLIRFDLIDPAKLYLHFNTDCDRNAEKQLQNALEVSGKEKGLTLLKDKSYKMESDEENINLQIRFISTEESHQNSRLNY